MYCVNCGSPIGDSAKVCPFCNMPVEEEPSVNNNQGWETPVGGGYEDYPVMDGNDAPDNGNNEKKKKNITLIVSLIVTFVIIAAGVVCYFLFLHERVVEYLEDRKDSSSQSDADDDSDDDDDEDKDKDDKDSEEITSGIVIDEAESEVDVPANSVAADFYISMSEDLEYCTFDISEDAVEFINNNENYFPCSESDFATLSLNSVYYSYSEILKSVGKYDAMTVYTDYLYVSQIYETENGEYTYIAAYDTEGNGHVGVFRGAVDGVYDGDYVRFFGTPLDKVDFSNYYGGTEPGIFYAISYCEIKTPEEYEEMELIDRLQTDPYGYFTEQDNYAPYIYQVLTKTGDNLRMRSWCTTETDDNVVTLLKHESLVYVYGFYDGWAYVTTYEGEYFEGWVSEDYVFPYYEY